MFLETSFSISLISILFWTIHSVAVPTHSVAWAVGAADPSLVTWVCSVCENSTNCMCTYLLVKSALLTDTIYLFFIQSITTQARMHHFFFLLQWFMIFLRQLLSETPAYPISFSPHLLFLFSSIFNFSPHSHFILFYKYN